MAIKDRMRIIHRKEKTKLFSNFNILLLAELLFKESKFTCTLCPSFHNLSSYKLLESSEMYLLKIYFTKSSLDPLLIFRLIFFFGGKCLLLFHSPSQNPESIPVTLFRLYVFIKLTALQPQLLTTWLLINFIVICISMWYIILTFLKCLYSYI